jgi:hypothetical protein
MPHLAPTLLTWLSTRFPHWFRHNAIACAEIAHQQRRDKTRRLWQIVAWWLRYLGLMIGLILAGSVFVGSVLQRDAYPITVALGILPILFCVAIIVAHYVLQFRTLVLATNSLAREREGATWELVLLTGIDSANIIRGKWWAVVQRQLPVYAWLGLLRACAIVWFSYYNASTLVESLSFAFEPPVNVIFDEPTELLFIATVTVIASLLNLAFTAACGLWGTSLTGSRQMSLLRGMGIRLLMGFLLLMILMSPIYILSPIQYIDSSSNVFIDTPIHTIMLLIIAALDDGLTVGTFLANVGYDYFYFLESPRLLENSGLLITLAGSMFMYLWVTRFILRRAEHRVEKLGMVKDSIIR